MQNNLPIKKKEGIFCKIKNYFRKIFGIKNKDNITVSEIDKNSSKINEDKTNFVNKLKEQNNNKNELNTKEEILEMIENDTNRLNTLSIERLEVLNKYYDKKIKEYKVILGKI